MTELAAPTPAVAPRLRGAHPLAAFVVMRVAAGLVTLFVVSILVFAGTELLPGDAASAILGAIGDAREAGRDAGADGPRPAGAVERYVDWLGGLLTGDLGNSAAGYAQGGELPIWDEIERKLSNSFVLAAITTLLMIPLSLLLRRARGATGGAAARPRDLASARSPFDLAARVRDRLAADPRLLHLARRAPARRR